jgi:hypothetical protein
MRIIRKPAMYFAMSILLLTQTGCFGGFALTSRVHEFHSDIGPDNLAGRFIRTVLFSLLGIVYYVTVSLDVIIFNLIEFWTGNNPLAMNEGDYEMQLATLDGVDYKIEATKDTFTTTQLTGEKAGEVRVMKFDRKSKTWFYTDSETANVPVMGLVDDKELTFRIYGAEGHTDLTMADIKGNDLLMAKLGDFEEMEPTASLR